MTEPGTKLPVPPNLESARSALLDPTATWSVAVLLPVAAAGSPPPETTAVLVRLPVAACATFTVSAIAGKLATAFNTSLRVQVSVASTQLQPEPLTAVAVSPAGNVSATLTTPTVEPV